MSRWFVLAMVLAVSSIANGQTPVRPAKVGDVHVYSSQIKSDGTAYEEAVTVTSTDGDQIRTQHVRTDRPAPTEGLYGKDWSVFKSGSSGMQMQPPSKVLPPQLAVAKGWDNAYEGTNAAGFKLRVKMDSTVTGQERLKTPAGEFDTWRIESKGYVNPAGGQGGWAIIQKVWYAPSIDRIVRIEYKEQRTLGLETVAEMKAFRPAP